MNTRAKEETRLEKRGKERERKKKKVVVLYYSIHHPGPRHFLSVWNPVPTLLLLPTKSFGMNNQYNDGRHFYFAIPAACSGDNWSNQLVQLFFPSVLFLSFTGQYANCDIFSSISLWRKCDRDNALRHLHFCAELDLGGAG